MKNSYAWRLLADYGVSAMEPQQTSAPELRYPAWIPPPLRDLAEIVLVVAVTLLAVLLFALAIYANAARALLQILLRCLHLSGAVAEPEEQSLWDWPQADCGKDRRPGGLS